MSAIKQLRLLLGKDDSRRLNLFLMGSILIAFLEMCSLVLLVPFLNLVTGSEEGFGSVFFEAIGAYSLQDKALFFGLFLVVVYFLRMVVILFYKFRMSHFVLGVRHDVTTGLFSKYACLDYVCFTSLSGSSLGRTVLNESNRIAVYIKAGLELFTEFVVVMFLLGLILYVDWKATVIAFGFFGLFVAYVIYFVRPKIKRSALDRAKFNGLMHYYFDNLFRDFKYIKSSLLEPEYVSRFGAASEGFSSVEAKVQYWQSFQKYTIETVCLLAVVFLVLFFLFNASGEVVEKLAFFAVAFFRLIPSANKITASISQLQYNQNVISQISEDLNLQSEVDPSSDIVKPLNFSDEINLENVSFSYGGGKQVLRDFNLRIKKGEHLGVFGESGAGKSTLIDMLLGIIFPEKGAVKVDGIRLSKDNLSNWRKMFGYIPQEICLFNSSIADNIAFGEELDELRVKTALEKAKIYDFFAERDGLQTRVGDNGIQLSGGQKQRIGIARALYQDPNILLLDEATSALDPTTEKEIMAEIYEIFSDKTLIVVAHRMSTLEQCGRQLELKKK